MAEPCGIGLDVAKATLDLACSTNPTARWQTTNDEAGWAALVAHVRTLPPAVVVLEATGGYETGAASALSTAGLPVAIVNPRQVRDFRQGARAVGKDRRPRCRRPRHVCGADPAHAPAAAR